LTDGDQLPTIDYLCYYFLPQRLAQIRDLRIHWQMDSIPYLMQLDIERESYGTKAWFQSWDSLRRMTGLRRLHINLEYGRSLWDFVVEKKWNESAEELLSMVKEITAPRDFVIVLPNGQCTTDIDVGNSNCILKICQPETDDTFPDT
jgi:hypothetical protein